MVGVDDGGGRFVAPDGDPEFDVAHVAGEVGVGGEVFLGFVDAGAGAFDFDVPVNSFLDHFSP